MSKAFELCVGTSEEKGGEEKKGEAEKGKERESACGREEEKPGKVMKESEERRMTEREKEGEKGTIGSQLIRKLGLKKSTEGTVTS